MNNVIDFKSAAEKIIFRRLNCLRTFTRNYYRLVESEGCAPFNFDRVKRASSEIDRLERTLCGVRLQSGY